MPHRRYWRQPFRYYRQRGGARVPAALIAQRLEFPDARPSMSCHFAVPRSPPTPAERRCRAGRDAGAVYPATTFPAVRFYALLQSDILGDTARTLRFICRVSAPIATPAMPRSLHQAPEATGAAPPVSRRVSQSWQRCRLPMILSSPLPDAMRYGADATIMSRIWRFQKNVGDEIMPVGTRMPRPGPSMTAASLYEPPCHGRRYHYETFSLSGIWPRDRIRLPGYYVGMIEEISGDIELSPICRLHFISASSSRREEPI